MILVSDDADRHIRSGLSDSDAADSLNDVQMLIWLNVSASPGVKRGDLSRKLTFAAAVINGNNHDSWQVASTGSDGRTNIR